MIQIVRGRLGAAGLRAICIYHDFVIFEWDDRTKSQDGGGSRHVCSGSGVWHREWFRIFYTTIVSIKSNRRVRYILIGTTLSILLRNQMPSQNFCFFFIGQIVDVMRCSRSSGTYTANSRRSDFIDRRRVQRREQRWGVPRSANIWSDTPLWGGRVPRCTDGWCCAS